MSAEEATRTVRAAERARRMRRHGLRVGLPVVAALGAGAAFAAGAIPGSDHVIHGCYLSSPPVGAAPERYGQLRVIDPGNPVTLPTGGPDTTSDRCLPDETAISWNEQGPAGPQGPAGQNGGQGPQGADGSVLVGNTAFGLSASGSQFLKLSGIKGEATAKDHKDDIEITSFAIGATNTGSQSSGLSTGKVSFNSFTITKKVDKASPALFAAVTSGKHITTGEVDFSKKISGKPLDYLSFKFTDLLVSSVKLGGQGNAPTEQVTVSFKKLTETFQGYNAKGQKIAPVTVQVNVNNSAKF